MSSTELKEKENTLISATRDIDENSIISLSTIAKILQDGNSETPRRLVDQLLMAQRKKKKNSIIQDTRKKTMMPSNEKSILTMPTGIFNKFDDNIDNHSAKISLDKTKNEIANEIDTKLESTRISFPLTKDVKETDFFTNVSKKKILKEEACSENASSSFVQDLGMY